MTDGIVKQQGHTMVNIAIRAMRRGLCDDRLADDLQLILVLCTWQILILYEIFDDESLHFY